MVEDLILRVLHLSLLFDNSQLLHIVSIVKVFKLFILYDSILVGVNLIEEGSNVVVTNGTKEVGKRLVEIVQR